MAYFTRDETDIIRKHRFDTTCYVLSNTGECLDLAETEIQAVTGRTLKPVRSRRLPSRRARSWMMAVILCPGDDTEALGAWAARLKPEDVERVVFYEAADLPDLTEVYAGWVRNVAADPNRFPVDGFAHLNRLLGLDLNRRILHDHRTSPP